MDPDVVAAIATGREAEKREVMDAIRRSAEHPEKAPQHLIVYGERGSGKSFLMRMVEIEVEGLARNEGKPVVCVLLPEEHYNIKSPHQLLEAVAAGVRGADWSESAYALDFRPAAEAWESAVESLHAALDERFGAGGGLVVAVVENFDALVKDFFGDAPAAAGAKKGRAATAAAERRASEERLRKLMGSKGGRLMLVATATGTVEQDYERPLFLAFQPVDITPWSADACIEYFNRRRALDDRPALTLPEEARGRAIAEFIGGNPRLAQLLADVLESSDARTIAEMLDELSDHLAEYYRRRMEDLPPSARGLLDALIRKGEPCSQSDLAERVGVRQSQIADAFQYLVKARLLNAEAEKDGAGTLYRVRDRLFVHFYRRRYGGLGQREGLAPIAELLESFFTAREREERARRHLELGEFAEADIYHCSLGSRIAHCQAFCNYRDRLVVGAPSKLFELAGLTPGEMKDAQIELRDHPNAAVKRWSDVAGIAETILRRTVALLLKAMALSRYDLDGEAWTTLEEALRVAETDDATDARILALDQMAVFLWVRSMDESRALKICEGLAGLIEGAHTDYARGCAYVGLSAHALHEKRYQEAVENADAALRFAVSCGDVSLQIDAFMAKVFALHGAERYAEVLEIYGECTKLAQRVGDITGESDRLHLAAGSLYVLGMHEKVVLLVEEALKTPPDRLQISYRASLVRYKISSLKALGRHTDLIQEYDTALKFEKDLGGAAEQAAILCLKAYSLGALGRREEAISVIDEAFRLTQQAGDVFMQARCLYDKAFHLGLLSGHKESVSTIEEALKYAQQSGDSTLQAMCLRNKALELNHLLQHEEALCAIEEALKLTELLGDIHTQASCALIKAWILAKQERVDDGLIACDQAIALARSVCASGVHSDSLSLKANLLWRKGQFAEALDNARLAIVVSLGASLAENWKRAVYAFSKIASRESAPDVVERFEEWLRSVANETAQDFPPDVIAAAVTRAEKWPEFRACVQEHAQWFAGLKPSRVFDEVGKVWASQAEKLARARVYASIARELPVIAEVMRLIPHLEGADDLPNRHLRDLIAGFLASCSDAGLIRDVSQLIVDVFGPGADAEARRMQSFAEFHAAEDKEKVLQQFDPDLATAIRRMWSIPEPEDILARKGRRRSR
jgi:tetratricopeptide (TPR) repeat protein